MAIPGKAKAVLTRASAAAKSVDRPYRPDARLISASGEVKPSRTIGCLRRSERYRLRYPGVIVSTTIGNSENMSQPWFAEGSADLEAGRSGSDDPTLVIAPLRKTNSFLVAP
mgnify:CR=1 FL=1